MLPRGPENPFTLSRGAGLLAIGAALSCGGASGPPPANATSPGDAASAPTELRPPEAFASIADPDARARALFLEASRVLFSPRCVNCHPSDDAPRQREASEAHEPPVVRGEDDNGVPGMRCGGCHQDQNLALSRVPGAADWRLAPRSMAWAGKSAADVCAQLKDPARNGNRTLDRITFHAAHDPLVAWGWSPGADRASAPGSQARFAALVAAWIEAGAACPSAADTVPLTAAAAAAAARTASEEAKR